MNYTLKNYLRTGLILFIICAFYTNASAFKVRSTMYGGNKYVYLSDIAKFFGMKLSVNKMYSKLYSKYSLIRFNNNSKDVILNGIKVYLSLPAIYNNGKPIISETDLTLLVNPILRSQSLTKHRLRTIVIDPGHGGKDEGAAGTTFKEKNIALSIAKKLRNILLKNGFKVIMTRSSDRFIPLKSRPAICNKYNGDIFVSIHCNAASKQVKGIETFIYTPLGTASTHSYNNSGKAHLGNLSDKNNAKLGYEIHKRLINSKYTKTNDRGLKRAKFAVLRYSSVPAVLIETGFISNSNEQRLLGSSNYQTALATSIASGIIAYRNAILESN